MAFYVWTLVKLVTGFVFIIMYLNISGRTQISQMNSIDLIGNFILGGIIGGVIYNPDIAYYEYVAVLFVGVVILLGVNYIYRKYDRFRNVAIGRQIPIIKDGKFIMENIKNKNNKIDILNIASQLNTQGIYSFNDVYYAQVEPNGSVTAVRERGDIPAAIVCFNGSLREEELKDVEKTEDDFHEDMKKSGIDTIDDVFLGEYWKGKFRFVCKDGIVRSVKTRTVTKKT